MTEKTEMYVIWSHEHEAWWRANSSGYTEDLGAAGLYTRDEAADYVLDVIPPGTEIAVPARFAPMAANGLRAQAVALRKVVT